MTTGHAQDAEQPEILAIPEETPPKKIPSRKIQPKKIQTKKIQALYIS
jgi:hypothetical protein